MKGFSIIVRSCWMIKKKFNINDEDIANLLEKLSKSYRKKELKN